MAFFSGVARLVYERMYAGCAHLLTISKDLGDGKNSKLALMIIPSGLA